MEIADNGLMSEVYHGGKLHWLLHPGTSGGSRFTRRKASTFFLLSCQGVAKAALLERGLMEPSTSGPIWEPNTVGEEADWGAEDGGRLQGAQQTDGKAVVSSP